MEQADFLLDARHEVARVFLCLFMVFVPFEVEHVPGQLMLRILYFLQVLFVLLILLKLLELVALIVASRSRAMLTPFTKTDPAELMLASHTPHVVATLVLLYRLLAFRTGLSVCHNPL